MIGSAAADGRLRARRPRARRNARRRPVRPRPIRLVALGFAAVVASGCVGTVSDTARPAPVRTVSAAVAAETFDSAWSRVYRTYYDTTFNGVDWHAVRSELRPEAEAAGTLPALRGVIGDMVGRLGDSHFAVLPAEAADALDPDSITGEAGEPGHVGAELRVVAGELVVVRVEPDSPADRAGVRPGWVLEAVDTAPAARYLAVIEEMTGDERLAEARVAWAAETRLDGRVGDTLSVRFRDESDEPVEVRMRPLPVPGTPVKFGNMPTMISRLQTEEVPTAGGCVGVIRFNVWMAPIMPEFEDAMLGLDHCHGTVIDLRGNPGGMAGMIMGVSGYFLDEIRPLGRMITRDSELRLVSMPRRVTRDGKPMQPDTRPLAVVIDGQSMSTSELFAGGLQSVGRARVFGLTSGGQALPAMMMRLPTRDVLMYVFANYLDPDGTRIEGRGVVPDEHVPLTREDLIEGRDAALDAAVRWIEAQPRPITD